MAVPTGLEPAISYVTGRRDNQLHYGTILAPDHGFEPRPPGSEPDVLPLHQSGIWHALQDLNLRPPDS